MTERTTRNNPHYSRWKNIKSRCLDPSSASYRWYGARGISMCEEWLADSWAFADAIGECPGPGFSLDRIDNDGNYEPGNVRWATKQEQMANRRRMTDEGRANVQAAMSEPARRDKASVRTTKIMQSCWDDPEWKALRIAKIRATWDAKMIAKHGAGAQRHPNGHWR